MLPHKRDLKLKACFLTMFNFRSLDELRYIAKLSEASLKLDGSVLFSEIQIKNYDPIRSDRNRHGGFLLNKEVKHYTLTLIV